MSLDLSPPGEGIFPDYDSLLAYLQEHAKGCEYAVAVGRSTSCRDGVIRTRYIHCVRSGKPRDQVAIRKKPLVSQKTNCPFKCRAHLAASANEEEGQWELTVMNGTHNHEPSNPVAYHQHRKFSSSVRQQIATMTRSGVAPKEIASAITIEYPDLAWTIQDIYNVRRELKAELLEGKSPIEAMLHELETNSFEFNYQLDQDGHITLLFFAHPESLALLKRYPEVLLMDCTYKTNRFRMPLLDILGSTGLHRTFFVAFVFLSSEIEGDYTSALKMLYGVMQTRGIVTPKVIVTDKDQGLMNAISFVFPRSHNLLCSWHINKNVLSYSRNHKLHEKDSEEEGSFMRQWYSIVSSETIEDYNKRWTEFQIRWQKHPELLRYLAKTWLDKEKERFVRCWADRHLHFGHRETSRAEGAHSVVKRYLQVSTGDLYGVLQKLSLMLAAQHREHHAAMEAARNRIPQSFRIPLFSTLIGHITPYALWQVYGQKQLLNRPALHHVCHRTHIDSMGIPCYHIIKERLEAQQTLYQHDFHPRWFFDQHLEQPIQAVPRPILNPIVVQTRGRPQNRQPLSSTTRDPSSFERAAANRSTRRKKTLQKNPPARARKQTRLEHKSQSQAPTELEGSDESEYHDSSEDELMHQEIARLVESHGTSEPLWTHEPDLAGMTQATRAYTLRERKKRN